MASPARVSNLETSIPRCRRTITMASDRPDIVIVGGARTPIGKFGGSLKDVPAFELGAIAIRAALERSKISPEDVNEVIMGQVGQVGHDAYNARRCALTAGIPCASTAMNVNRLCSSGLQAIITGAQQLLLEKDIKVVVAGGNENMSAMPFMDFNARDGYRLGPREMMDGTMSLITDPFKKVPMGVTAENVAERFSVDREAQDTFAARSQNLAEVALREGHFDSEIVPVPIPRSKGPPFSRDEHLRAGTTVEGLSALRPVFKHHGTGTVTAGNSSGVNDGAAAVVLMRRDDAVARGIKPIMRFVSFAVCGLEPEIMGYGPALAIPKALEKANITLADVDLFELNEAFASQAIACSRALGLDMNKVNVSGGGIALGHPVGATGAILTVKLMYALERLQKRIGVVSMCIGGGQGMAAVFERL
eukprot:jgi/Mesvir1/16517/Mv10067-RA.1